MSLTGKHLITVLEEMDACAAAGPAVHRRREIVIEVDDIDTGEEVTRCTLYRVDIDELRYALQQADWADIQVGLREVIRRRAAGVRVDDIALVMERSPPPEPVAIEEMVFA